MRCDSYWGRAIVQGCQWDSPSTKLTARSIPFSQMLNNPARKMFQMGLDGILNWPTSTVVKHISLKLPLTFHICYKSPKSTARLLVPFAQMLTGKCPRCDLTGTNQTYHILGVIKQILKVPSSKLSAARSISLFRVLGNVLDVITTAQLNRLGHQVYLKNHVRDF